MSCRFALNERDGYEALQVGFGDKPRRLASRSQRGHVARLESKRAKRLSGAGVELPPKADCEPPKFIREFRGPAGEYTVGQELKVALFADIKASTSLASRRVAAPPA